MSYPSSIWSVLGSILFSIWLINPGQAHNVKTDGGVGATFHIEPNHNPRAGEKNLAWFALTRPGGQIIPLEQCNCQLAVYNQAQDTAILNPPLQPISVEQYQGIPSAEIVFPHTGVYQLEISGSPQSGASFADFKLTYSVTVSPGTLSSHDPTPEQTTQEQSQVQDSEEFDRQWLIYALGVMVISAVISFVLVSKRGKSPD